MVCMDVSVWMFTEVTKGNVLDEEAKENVLKERPIDYNKSKVSYPERMIELQYLSCNFPVHVPDSLEVLQLCYEFQSP